jgi:hypothetical protein
MDNPGPAPLSAAATGRPSRVMVDLAILLGLGFSGMMLSAFLPEGTEEVIRQGVALLAWVGGFALAGLREPSGRLWLGVVKLWAFLALVLVAVGVVWFLWLAVTIHHPLRLFWRDALGWAVIPVGLAAYAAVPSLAGWVFAVLVRRLKSSPCAS